jgi:hypothetical protein
MQGAWLALPSAHGRRFTLENCRAGGSMILTIPAKRPIKTIYIRKLVEMTKGENDGPEND